MGPLYNGKYELYDYLVSAYHFEPFKTLTTRKKHNSCVPDIFKVVSLDKMVEAEHKDNLIYFEEYDGNHYGKLYSDLPMGFSVCITNYHEYQLLSDRVNTVGILINQELPKRYQRNFDCNHYSPSEFLKQDDESKDVINQMLADDSITKFNGDDLTQLKLKFDNFMKPYLKYLPRDIPIKRIKK